MIVFPNAKINIGLHIMAKRPDGYHELETIFYPVKLYDVMEVIDAKELGFFPKGIAVDGNAEENICLKAYHLLAKDYKLPPVEIHLLKNIPIGAGLGGGSSDGAFMIKLLNEKFRLRMPIAMMETYAKQLGADCAFFIQNKSCYAEGIGSDFFPLELDLKSYHFVIVKPEVAVSTAEAYRSVIPNSDRKPLRNAIQIPIQDWKNTVINDFEAGIFEEYPQIREIKEELYESGAVYASMSGSGSAVFGIFKDKTNFPTKFNNHQIFYC